eukprot:13612295-Alexandrium_andersonii.AAC.1
MGCSHCSPGCCPGVAGPPHDGRAWCGSGLEGRSLPPPASGARCPCPPGPGRAVGGALLAVWRPRS